MKVLHVTDCMNGGVSAAIIDLVRTNPQQEHILLWRTKPDSPEPSDEELSVYFKAEFRLKRSLLLSILQLRKLAYQLQPEFIHLHSSKAGFIGRVIPSRIKVYYSSHGFGFQRTDVPKIFRYLFLKIELAMCNKTDKYVAFWPLDFQLACSILKYKHVIFYANSMLRNFPTLAVSNKLPENKSFVTTARLAKAKDPLFLVKTIQLMQSHPALLSELSSSPKFKWIGSFGKKQGSIKISNQMRSVGIVLIPWKRPEHLIEEIARAEATIITSAWESGPMTFYESLMAGTPVLMRDIDAVSMYSFQKYLTPESFSSGILRYLNDSSYRAFALKEQIQAVNLYLEGQTLTYQIYD